MVRAAAFTGLVVALGLFAGATGADEARTQVLGRDGTVFELRSGAAEELFPGAAGIPSDNSVLALEITRPGEPRQRVLVPGTVGRAEETDYLVVRDEAADAVFVIYQSLHNNVHPFIRLARYDASGWGDQVDVVNSPFGEKIAPRMLLTRGEGSAPAPTTAIHLVWGEDSGDIRHFYHGLVLLRGGTYLGWTPIFPLNGFASGNELGDAGVAGGLFTAISGVDRQSGVVIGFVDAETGRLVTLRTELLPAALVGLAERARMEIIGIGYRSLTPEAVQTALLAIETELHDGMKSYLAAHVAELSAALGELRDEDELVVFAERARMEIIGIGSRVGPSAVEEPEATTMVEIEAAPGGAPVEVLETTVRLDLAVPTGIGEDARLILAPSGERALLAWPGEEGQLAYREASVEGWGDVSSLDFGALGLDLAGGLDLLASQLGGI